MNRNEFTDNLRASLNGKIPPVQVEDNIRYYDDYINTQIRLGRTEEDIMVELGDPRLIAKTIVSTSTGDATRSCRETDGYEEAGGSYDEYDDTYAPASTGMKFLQWYVGWPGWAKLAVGVTAGFGVMWIVLNVLSFLAPVLIPLCIIGIIVKLARDGL